METTLLINLESIAKQLKLPPHSVQRTAELLGDWRKTGSLYAVDDVRAERLAEAKVKDGEWFDYYIKVRGNHVIIKINDMTMVDYTQPEKPKHLRDTPGRILGEGTFCLQAHDPGSTVYFKGIHVRPLH